MIDVYILNLRKCREALISLVPYVSIRRQRVFEHVLIENSKLYNIASEAILALALKLPLPCDYQTQSNGKPYIEGQKKFNISHSGDYAICAVSDNEVGADVAVSWRYEPRLASKFLAPEEMKALDYIDEDKVLRYLCEKWARKEAYLKLSGVGLRIRPNTLCFDGDILLLDKSIFSRVFSLSEKEVICICAEKEDDINFIEVTPDDIKGLKEN